MPIESFLIGVAAAAVGLILFVKVGNPCLDNLIVPKEEDEDDSKKEPLMPFNQSETNVLRYNELGFVKPQVDKLELNIGITFLVAQSFPKWLTHLLDKCSSSGSYKKNPNKDKYEMQPVDILDAREYPHLEFAKTGFTLLQMDQPSQTNNWRNKEDVKKFQEEIRPELMKLYPDATRIEYTYSIVRGGSKLGDQPAAVNGPHLDYSQDDAARVAFHETFPVNDAVKEQLALLGRWDTDEDEVGALIGIWKPIDMKNPVYDHPLAVMDASTFAPAQERPHHLHFDFGLFTLHNLNGGICYNKDQKWYYYSFQDDQEVLVFTQYTKGKHFCNPHTSFLNPNRPSGAYDSRVSVEMRAAVFFPKKKD